MSPSPDQERLAEVERRLSQIIGLCGQEGCDGEPYSTIYAVAVGDYDTRGMKPVEPEDDDLAPFKVHSAPARIYLVMGELDSDCTFDECEEVTWCQDAQFPSDIEYRRVP